MFHQLFLGNLARIQLVKQPTRCADSFLCRNRLGCHALDTLNFLGEFLQIPERLSVNILGNVCQLFARRFKCRRIKRLGVLKLFKNACLLFGNKRCQKFIHLHLVSLGQYLCHQGVRQ